MATTKADLAAEQERTARAELERDAARAQLVRAVGELRTTKATAAILAGRARLVAVQVGDQHEARAVGADVVPLDEDGAPVLFALIEIEPNLGGTQ